MEVNEYFDKIATLETTKQRGDEFERFCYNYLCTQYEFTSLYKAVWMLKDIPFEIAQKLKLDSKKDRGIDAIAQLRLDNNKFIGIQMKYRYDEDSVTAWTKLATFVGSLYGDIFAGGLFLTNQKSVCNTIKHRNIQFILLGNFEKLSTTELDKVLKFNSFDITDEVLLPEIEEQPLKFEYNETLKYNCKRCHFCSNNKTDLVRHLKKKFICTAIKSNEDRNNQLNELNNNNPKEKVFCCSKCKKQLSTKFSRDRHEEKCTLDFVEEHLTQTADINLPVSIGVNNGSINITINNNNLKPIVKNK